VDVLARPGGITTFWRRVSVDKRTLARAHVLRIVEIARVAFECAFRAPGIIICRAAQIFAAQQRLPLFVLGILRSTTASINYLDRS